ncbi:hypothetical protein ACFVT5_37670 [Streptomyces sp. NPDC058001]|uniref:hypothetical protein n=1 Tax=Streptomyces sp. NPDC058001 TaxID=3346300 RepID=UPI0036EA9ACD
MSATALRQFYESAPRYAAMTSSREVHLASAIGYGVPTMNFGFVSYSGRLEGSLGSSPQGIRVAVEGLIM